MKINVNNIDKLQVALDNVQARCTVRTLSAECVQEFTEWAELHASRRLAKKDLPGLGLTVQHPFGGPIPGAYKGTPEGTYVILHRCPTGWYVTAVGRCPAKANRKWAVIDYQGKEAALLAHTVATAYAEA